MTVSIEWPYGSNLHCEILVDDQIVAQADQFIAPRLFRVKDDPLYGTLQCGAALDSTCGRMRRRRSTPPADERCPPGGLAAYCGVRHPVESAHASARRYASRNHGSLASA